MKNYKTEINKIRDLYYFGDITGEQLTDSMINIIREIVQESLGEHEHFQSIFDGTDGFIRRIRNEFRDEILSNIEKVI